MSISSSSWKKIVMQSDVKNNHIPERASYIRKKRANLMPIKRSSILAAVDLLGTISRSRYGNVARSSLYTEPLNKYWFWNCNKLPIRNFI